MEIITINPSLYHINTSGLYSILYQGLTTRTAPPPTRPAPPCCPPPPGTRCYQSRGTLADLLRLHYFASSATRAIH